MQIALLGRALNAAIVDFFFFFFLPFSATKPIPNLQNLSQTQIQSSFSNIWKFILFVQSQFHNYIWKFKYNK